MILPVRNDESPNERTISDQSYDLLGEMILERDTRRLLLELEADKASGSTAEMDAFFAARDARFLKIINRGMRRAWVQSTLAASFLRAAQAVSMVIICLTLLGSIALASSESLRVQLLQLLAVTTEEYTLIRLAPTPEPVEVPQAWQGDYYLTYLPEGFELKCSSNRTVQYRSPGEEGLSFYFSSMGMNGRLLIDSEDATVNDVLINNQPAHLVMKDETVTICWAIEDCYFIIDAHGLSKSEVIRIAQNVTASSK
ncbi:MAG: DUF4367 domain-containing protein [Clostridia bacterium]|nr:DUF4367 domain-containing protein [Clostridia bacterium]